MKKRVITFSAVVLLSLILAIRSYKSRKEGIERSMAPLISTIEAFHDANGRFPSYNDLIQRNTVRLPVCPSDGRNPIYAVGSGGIEYQGIVPGNGYVIYCNFFFLEKYKYDSRRRRWEIWDS